LLGVTVVAVDGLMIVAGPGLVRGTELARRADTARFLATNAWSRVWE
jgi:hypothetical protein